MKRLAFALAAVLLAVEAAHAFRTPSVRSRARAPDQPPAAVRMPDDATPKPAAPGAAAKPDITVAPAPGEAKPEATVAPPAAAPKPAVSVVPPPAPKPEVTAVPPVLPKPEVTAVPPVLPKPKVTAAPPKPEVSAAPPASFPKPEATAAPAAATKPEVPVAPPAAAPRPEVAATPAPAPAKPEAAPAPAREPPAAVAAAAPSTAAVQPAVQAPPPAPAIQTGKIIESIFACLAPGLPNDWKKAWIVVTELGAEGKERRFEAKFYYSDSLADDKGETLVPCDSREIAVRVYTLNELLAPEQRRWREAKLIIISDGKFEIKYDY